jgi:hypothetical protein
MLWVGPRNLLVFNSRVKSRFLATLGMTVRNYLANLQLGTLAADWWRGEQAIQVDKVTQVNVLIFKDLTALLGFRKILFLVFSSLTASFLHFSPF